MTRHHQLDEPKWHKEGAGANQCECVCVNMCRFSHVRTGVYV